MKIGIIAEGRSDIRVIERILKGCAGIDSSDVLHLRPEDQFDETSLAEMDEKQFSSWTCVREECRTQGRIDRFINSPIEDERFVIIQMDSAERGEYGVPEPNRSHITDWKEYSREVRENIIGKILEWTENKFGHRLLYAICVEELDAWLIPLYDSNIPETAQKADPKKYLWEQCISTLKSKEKNAITSYPKLSDRYHKLAEGLKKPKVLKLCAYHNESLRLFCDSLEFLRN